MKVQRAFSQLVTLAMLLLKIYFHCMNKCFFQKRPHLLLKIDNGLVAIDFESVKPKPNRGRFRHSYAGYAPLHIQEGNVINEGPVHMQYNFNQGNTDYTAQNLAGNQTLQSYLSMLRKSQVDTNNAIRALTKENTKIKNSHEKSQSLCESRNTLLSSVYVKLDAAESNFRKNVTLFWKSSNYT